MKRTYLLSVVVLAFVVVGCSRYDRPARTDVYVRPADRVVVAEPVTVEVDPDYAMTAAAAVRTVVPQIPVMELRRPAPGARSGLFVDRNGRTWQRISGSVRPTLDLSPIPDGDGAVDHMGGERTGATHLSYPLANGEYTVRLFFIRPTGGEVTVSERVFQASVEGKLIDSIDVAQLMSSGSGVEARDVRVTDGKLDILFTAQVNSDLIRMIEVVEE